VGIRVIRAIRIPSSLLFSEKSGSRNEGGRVMIQDKYLVWEKVKLDISLCHTYFTTRSKFIYLYNINFTFCCTRNLMLSKLISGVLNLGTLNINTSSDII